MLKENRDAGDYEAEILTQQELREFEPSLSKSALGAVFCPYEAVVEPWLVPMGYAESARKHGANIRLNSTVTDASFNKERGIWTLSVD